MKYDIEINPDQPNTSHAEIIKRVKSGDKVLDLGCSSGYHARLFKERYNSYVMGVEYDPDLAEKAREICDEVLVADLDRVDLHNLLDNHKFDVVLCADILEHLKNPLPVLKSLHDHLTADGYLLVSLPNAAHLSVRLELLQGHFDYEELGILDETHLHFYTRNTLISLLNDGGFLVTEISYTYHDLPDEVIAKHLSKVGLPLTEEAKKHFREADAAAYQFILIARSADPALLPQETPLLSPKPMQESGETYGMMKDQYEKLEKFYQSSQIHIRNLETLNRQQEQIQQQIRAEKERIDCRVAAQDIVLREREVQILNQSIDNKNQADHIENQSEHIKNLEHERHNIITELNNMQAVADEHIQFVRILTTSRSYRLYRILLYPFRLIVRLLKRPFGHPGTVSSIDDREPGSRESGAREIDSREIDSREIDGREIDGREIDGREDPGGKEDSESAKANALNTNEETGLDKEIHEKERNEQNKEVNADNAYLYWPYSDWIDKYDSYTAEQDAAIINYIQQIPKPPVISIIMPVYNTPTAYLEEALDSVVSQSYPYWELCICDDASSEPQVATILAGFQYNQKRIKVVRNKTNEHIVGASNKALSVATGDYICFLDHDDKLARHALYWMSKEVLEHPEALLIYSDEDKISDKDERFDPYFKPDWNADLMLSHNMLNHLTMYRADAVTKAGGFRQGFEGAQDYDLALRILDNIKFCQVRHIPRVLYHWRVLEGSTAASIDEKPYAHEAAMKAIQECLDRRKVNAHVLASDEAAGMNRVKYYLPKELPKVSLIIPTRNCVNLLRVCVESIMHKTAYANTPLFDSNNPAENSRQEQLQNLQSLVEIIIMDNGSGEQETLDYFDSLSKYANVHIIRDDGPFNFSALNNQAVARASGEIVGLLNNDLEVINGDWLEEMVSHALRPEIGIVGARLWYPDHTLQHGGVVLGVGGVAGHAFKHLPKGDPGQFGRAVLLQNYSAVTGACMVMRKSVYEEAGGLNERDLAVAFNDIDFCLRVLELGYRNIWTPYAQLYHHESASRGDDDTPEKNKRFQKEISYMQKRWKKILHNDKAYNSNLTLKHESFALSWPPRKDFFSDVTP